MPPKRHKPRLFRIRKDICDIFEVSQDTNVTRDQFAMMVDEYCQKKNLFTHSWTTAAVTPNHDLCRVLDLETETEMSFLVLLTKLSKTLEDTGQRVNHSLDVQSESRSDGTETHTLSKKMDVLTFIDDA